MSSTIVPTEAMVASLRGPRSSRPYAEQSDHELVMRASRGDEDALAELYDRHGRVAYRIALSVTQSSASAQDAVQEAFVQLWLRAAPIDPRRTSVAAWVVLLARRRAIDLARYETRASRPLSTDPLQIAAQTADEPVREGHERQRARVAIEALAPDHRAVIELAYFRGLSQSETAVRLAIPLGTVKSRTRTALACLRGTLSDLDRTPPTPRARDRSAA